MVQSDKWPSYSTRFKSIVGGIGSDPDDSDDLRLKKSLMVSISILISLAGFLWGATYFAFGEVTAAVIPITYSVVSCVSIFIFAATRRFQFYRFSQLLLILLLPFFLMVSLGGFVNSSVVILWSLLSPLGALVFSSLRSAIWWFLTYASLVIISGFLQPYVRPENNLSPTVIILFFVMNIVAISAIAFVLLYYFINQKDSFYARLVVEQEKSERLLLNILPREIADILKVDNRVIADKFDSASIMFADLVGFTGLTAEMAPEEMVVLINDIYSRFDDLVDRYGVEKIRTIGDNYMVVSGVPKPRSDHALALAEMALEMSDFLDGFSANNGQPIQFRIGINTGSLIAGVVGRKKFQYDVWGEAVNIASRMESQGVPGKIQITSTTYDLVKGKYLCEPRGKIDVKGVGQMPTWFLIARAEK